MSVTRRDASRFVVEQERVVQPKSAMAGGVIDWALHVATMSYIGTYLISELLFIDEQKKTMVVVVILNYAGKQKILLLYVGPIMVGYYCNV